MLLGESYARTMGIDVRRTRLITVVSASLLTGATTAFCGPIAFLGLAVPHLARLALGTSDHRAVLPTVVLMGSAVALACGIVSQVPGSDAVLPVNAVTALIGAPIVVLVLVRSRHGVGMQKMTLEISRPGNRLPQRAANHDRRRRAVGDCAAR